MVPERELRCAHCGKVLGKIIDDRIEIKCQHCKKVNQIDPKTKRVIGIIKKTDDKGGHKKKQQKLRKPVRS